MNLSIVIPTNMHPASASIAKGSGIVADLSRPDGIVVVWYEGNIYGASNLHQFEERITCAAGRAQESYPTVAKIALSRQDYNDAFAEIGKFSGLIRKRTHEIVIKDTITAQQWADKYKASSD